MNKQRYLLVVSGPSGAGKDTVVSRMMQKHPEIEISVSATTRAPRAGETDGENYYFLTNEQFEAKIDRGEMLEYVNYCGKYYGTPKSEVDAAWTGARPLCWSLRWWRGEYQKALSGKHAHFHHAAQYGRAARPPARPRDRERRGDCRPAQAAEEELPYAREYDFSVENRDVDACADEIYRI